MAEEVDLETTRLLRLLPVFRTGPLPLGLLLQIGGGRVSRKPTPVTATDGLANRSLTFRVMPPMAEGKRFELLWLLHLTAFQAGPFDQLRQPSIKIGRQAGFEPAPVSNTEALFHLSVLAIWWRDWELNPANKLMRLVSQPLLYPALFNYQTTHRYHASLPCGRCLTTR